MNNIGIDSLSFKQNTNYPNSNSILFKNANQKSEYVPFYSVLYRDHLDTEFNLVGNFNIKKYIDFAAFLTTGTIKKFCEYSILYESIFKVGLATFLVGYYKTELNNITVDQFKAAIKEHKEELKTYFMEALEKYIFSTPDFKLLVQQFTDKYNFTNDDKFIIEANKQFNDYKTSLMINNKTPKDLGDFNSELLVGNFILAHSTMGVLSSIMVKRESVPLLRSKHLLSGVWDTQLMELWVTKNLLSFYSKSNLKFTEIPFSSQIQTVIVENFENIFYVNEFKTLQQRRQHLEKMQNLLKIKAEEGLKQLDLTLTKNKETAKENLISEGFILI